MVENMISGLYLVGDVALLGLLVYNSHKPHHKIKRGWRHLRKRANQGLATTTSRPTRTSREEVGPLG
jgi:hypothetical protein